MKFQSAPRIAWIEPLMVQRIYLKLGLNDIVFIFTRLFLLTGSRGCAEWEEISKIFTAQFEKLRIPTEWNSEKTQDRSLVEFAG